MNEAVELPPTQAKADAPRIPSRALEARFYTDPGMFKAEQEGLFTR